MKMLWGRDAKLDWKLVVENSRVSLGAAGALACVFTVPFFVSPRQGQCMNRSSRVPCEARRQRPRFPRSLDRRFVSVETSAYRFSFDVCVLRFLSAHEQLVVVVTGELPRPAALLLLLLCFPAAALHATHPAGVANPDHVPSTTFNKVRSLRRLAACGRCDSQLVGMLSC